MRDHIQATPQGSKEYFHGSKLALKMSFPSNEKQLPEAQYAVGEQQSEPDGAHNSPVIPWGPVCIPQHT